jgi:hypothetical protein
MRTRPYVYDLRDGFFSERRIHGHRDYHNRRQAAAYFEQTARWVDEQTKAGMPHYRAWGRRLYFLPDCRRWLLQHDVIPKALYDDMVRAAEAQKRAGYEVTRALLDRPRALPASGKLNLDAGALAAAASTARVDRAEHPLLDEAFVRAARTGSVCAIILATGRPRSALMPNGRRVPCLRGLDELRVAPTTADGHVLFEVELPAHMLLRDHAILDAVTVSEREAVPESVPPAKIRW